MAVTLTVTRDPTKTQFAPGTSATLGYDIIADPTATEVNVLAGLLTQQNVYRGASHPIDPLMRVRGDGLSVSQISQNFWQATVSFAWGISGTTDNPLNEPPTYQWQPETVTELVNTDYYGTILRNSAGTLPSSGSPLQIRRRSLCCERNETVYPLDLANQYEMSYNSDTFFIGGKKVEPGQAFLKSIVQLKPQRLNYDFVRCSYLCAFHPGWQKDSKGVWDGFRLRIVDKGKQAWFPTSSSDSTPRLDFICLPKSDSASSALPQRVSEDVILSGDGRPYYVNDYVNQAGLKSVSSPRPLPTGATLWTPPGGIGVLLIWERYKPMAFGPLKLFA